MVALRRRSFLTALCAAFVFPALPTRVAPAPGSFQLLRDELMVLRLIEMRRQATAMLWACTDERFPCTTAAECDAAIARLLPRTRFTTISDWLGPIPVGPDGVPVHFRAPIDWS